MPDAYAQQLIARHETLSQTRTGYWETLWQEIADHVVGRRDFNREDTPGRRREINIYDTTGRVMVGLLAGGLHSLLVNPATEWFLLRTADAALMEDHEVRLWLDLVETRLYSIFNAPQARFTSQMDEVFLDLVTFGTAGLFIDDPPGKNVMFAARPLPEIYISEDASGVVDTVHRKYKLSARQALKEFGNAAPQRAREMVDRNQGEGRLVFLHTIFPSDDPKLGFGGQRMPFDSVFLCLDDQSLVSQGGFHEMPLLTPRWRVDGSEQYGRGPAGDALADQKMASAMKLTTLQAGQMAVAPPFLTEDDSSIVQLDLRPLGRIIVRPGGLLNPPVQALDFQPKAEIGVELIRDTRAQVQEAFYFELLKLIQNRGLTPMTAEQVRALRDAVQRLMSPILGRLHSELLGPMIDRVFGIAARRGAIPPAPPILQGQQLEVEYQSPITRAQREGEIEAVDAWLARLSVIAERDPSVLDNVDLDETARFLGETGSVPARLMRNKAQVARLRKAQQELAAREEQMESALAAADIAGKVSPLVRKSA